MTKLQKVIYKMLTEDVGWGLCDSSNMGYSSSWRKRKEKSIEDFINEPEVYFMLDDYTGFYAKVSTFHYLAGAGSNLILDDYCKKFNKLNKEPLRQIITEKAEKYLLKKFNLTYDDLFDDCYNTYNDNNDLDCFLQYSIIEIDGDQYLFLQVHGGSDIRGGYTNVKMFKLKHFQEGINEYISECNDIDDGNSYDIYSETLGRYLNDVETEYAISMKHLPIDRPNGKDWIQGLSSYLETPEEEREALLADDTHINHRYHVMIDEMNKLKEERIASQNNLSLF
jgi:hypothetical protein